MESSVVSVASTIITWLKGHYCWQNISFWDFSVALFLTTTFCRIVFHNYETPEMWVDVGRGNAGIGSEYHY